MSQIQEHVLLIEAGKIEKEYWKDLWRYRELLGFLCWRDILVRYKQTVIGVLWAVIRPLLTMVAFTLIFGKLAKLPSTGEAPYALMVFAALLPWQFFATALADSANSLVGNAHLISKVFFPRLMVPMSSIAVNVVDLCVSFVLLFCLMLWYQFIPSWQIICILPLTLLTAIIALGPGLILCSLNVAYRDFRHLVPFITQFGLYLSPVGFSSSIVPEKWRLLYECNPMVGMIEAFRWAILGNVAFPLRAFSISCVAALLFMYLGIRIFRRTERTFADII